LYPTDVPWSHAHARVRIPVAGGALSWAGSRCDDGPAVQRGGRIPDIVAIVSVIVSLLRPR
jgi:hypothetical protein